MISRDKLGVDMRIASGLAAALIFTASCVTSASAFTVYKHAGITLTHKYCAQTYDIFNKKPKYRAFAVSKDGKQCGGYWGAQSQQWANKYALQSCRKKPGKQDCVLFPQK